MLLLSRTYSIAELFIVLCQIRLKLKKDIQLSGILIELRFGQQNCYTARIIYQVKQRVTGKSCPV